MCCGHHVKVFSYSSQELVHTLMHHTDRVTSVLINPTNKIQVGVVLCTIEPLCSKHSWDFTHCPDCKGVLISGVDLAYIGTF